MPDNHPALLLLLYSGLTIFILIPLSSWFMLYRVRNFNANLWFIGTGLYSLTAIFFVFGNMLPLLVRGPLISMMALSSVLILYESLRRETSDAHPRLSVYILLILGELAILFTTYSHEEYLNWGRSIHLTILSLAELALTFQANQIRKKHNSKSMWILMLTFMVYASINTARVIEFLMTGRFSGLLDFTATAQIALVINYVSVIFYCYGYWGFIVEKSQAEVIRATRETAIAHQAEILAIEKEQMTKQLLQERTEFMERLAEIGKLAHSGALSATIAHEMNQPLAAIQINVEEYERMMASTPLPEHISTLVTRIGFDSKRLAQIVKRVRAIFKEGKSATQTIDLDPLVRTCVEMMGSHLKIQRIDVQMQLAAIQRIHFTPGELEHVLINLINNSMESIQESNSHQGQILLKSWTDKDACYVSVTDNGTGIPESLHKQVFELSESTKPGGMGMGLWLAKYIMEKNGGHIWIDEGFSNGARFHLKFSMA